MEHEQEQEQEQEKSHHKIDISKTNKIIRKNGYYQCNLCFKEYKLKENFNKHYVSCVFFHKMCFETKDEANETEEHLPTQAELYRFIKEIALKCQRLEDEVTTLKQKLNVRQKKNIMEILNNDPNNEHRILFNVWSTQMVVTREHLEEVFDGNIISGIKCVIKSHLTEPDILPLRAFQGKNTLYIYDDDENGNKQWKIAPSNCFEKMVSSLERQFLKIFLEWQKENQDKISQSEKLKDDEIQYMMKICGYKLSGDKITLIKKWVMDTIEEEPSGVIIEY